MKQLAAEQCVLIADFLSHSTCVSVAVQDAERESVWRDGHAGPQTGKEFLRG